MIDTETGEVDNVMGAAELLMTHLNGRAHAQISRELHELVAAVQEHGKKGSLTIKFLIEPPKGHVADGPLAIAIESDLKAPKAVPPASIYFVDAEGNLTRNDPKQLSFEELRQVSATTTFKEI